MVILDPSRIMGVTGMGFWGLSSYLGLQLLLSEVPVRGFQSGHPGSGTVGDGHVRRGGEDAYMCLSSISQTGSRQVLCTSLRIPAAFKTTSRAMNNTETLLAFGHVCVRARVCVSVPP